MKSIAFVAPQAQIVQGGLERYVGRLAQLLISQKHKVTVYTIDTYNGKQHPDQTIDGVLYRRVPVLWDISQRFKLWPALYRALIAGSHDIIQCFLHSQSAFFVAYAAAQKSHAIFYATVYGPAAREAQYGPWEHTILSLVDTCAAPLLARSDRVFCRGIPVSQEYVASLGIPPHRVANSIAALEKRYLTDPPSKNPRLAHTILFNGRLHPDKGPQHIVEAVGQLRNKYPDIRLWLVGPDHGFRQTLEKQIARLSLESTVTIYGAVPEDKLIELMDTTSCFVVSSVFEGLSQAMLKAIARKTPIIATRIPSCVSILKRGAYGALYTYGHIGGLVRAISQIFTHGASYQKKTVLLRAKLSPYIYEDELPKLAVYYV